MRRLQMLNVTVSCDGMKGCKRKMQKMGDVAPLLELRHQQFCQYFRKSFANISAFQNNATIFKISEKIVISKF